MDDHRSIIELLEVAYALEVDRLQRLPHGWAGAPRYLVGAGGKLYFLKAYPRYLRPRDRSVAASLHHDLTILRAPIAPLVPTRLGQPIVDHERDAFVLQVWLDGRSLRRFDVVDCADGLGALSEMLAQAAAVRPPTRRWSTPKLRSVCFPDQPHELQAFCGRLAGEVSSRFPALAALARHMEKHVNEAIQTVLWRSLPAQFIHGDPGPDNFLRAAAGVCVIDFDDARWSFRIWDFVRSISQFAVGTERSSGAWRIDIRPDVIAAGLDSLDRICSLSRDERASIPPVLRLALLTTVLTEIDLDWEIAGLDPPAMLGDPHLLECLLTDLVQMVRTRRLP